MKTRVYPETMALYPEADNKNKRNGVRRKTFDPYIKIGQNFQAILGYNIFLNYISSIT